MTVQERHGVPEPIWSWRWIALHPLRFIGIQAHLFLRTAFALFWLAAGVNKLLAGWLTSDVLREVFLERLTQMPPGAFASLFLQHVAIPLYIPVALVMIVGEIYLRGRWSAPRPNHTYSSGEQSVYPIMRRDRWILRRLADPIFCP